MEDTSWLVTRFSTALFAFCWMKRVSSSALTVKPFQLMTAPGVLVTFRVLPLVAKVAAPLTTVGLVGLACACPAKQEATATTSALRRIKEVSTRFVFIDFLPFMPARLIQLSAPGRQCIEPKPSR